jgi:enamine deaminase RidA (YjgF/YER057c/UK114 family)
MSTNLRFLDPEAIRKAPGYTHVVEITVPGRLVYIAGQLGVDREGKMAADFRGQVAQAFENLKAALAAVGARPDQIVKLNNYLVDITANIATYREIRDRFVNTAAPPASTTIGVPALARDGALFEVEAVVALPPQ